MAEPTASPKQVLFTDVRHIRCGDLEWQSPEGHGLPVAAPPEPQIEARAHLGMVPRGIRLAAQKANKTEPLRTGPPGRVVFENGVYRSWGLAVEYPPGQDLGAFSVAIPVSVAIRYVESRDGFEWEEKACCPIRARGQTSFHGFTVFIDPKGPSDERYKALYSSWPPAEDRPALWESYQKVHPRHRDVRAREDWFYCMYGAVSPDGIHWEPIREPLMVHFSDTDTTAYYDSFLDRYVLYTRLYLQERRWIARAEAEDFRRWGLVEPLIGPGLDGPLSDDIYTNCRTGYPGLSGYHLMFPMIYHRYNQTSEVRLYSSPDGICWMQVPGGPVLSPGGLGQWDSEFVSVGKDLVPLESDRIAVRHHGTSFPHKYPRWNEVLQAGRSAWAWWPKGRLCAVVADQEGEFCTFPMVPAGRELRLNARTRRAGEVRAEVVDAPGRTIEDCDPISGDAPDVPVRWNGESDINTGAGEPVTLRFRLRAAELFGFEWT